MTLAELQARLETRATEADAMRATAPVADTLRWVVAEMATVSVTGHGGAALHVSPSHEHLLTAPEVAKRLECSVRHVYARARGWPFTVRDGRMVRFSAGGLDRWLARHP